MKPPIFIFVALGVTISSVAHAAPEQHHLLPSAPRTITASDGSYTFKALPSRAPDPQVVVVDRQRRPLGGMSPQRITLQPNHRTTKDLRLP